MICPDGRVRSIASACIGFGLYWAWVYLSFDSGVFLEEGVESRYAVFAIHGVSTASALAGFALYAFAGSKLSRQRRFGLSFLGSLVASVGTLLYAVPPFSSSFALCLAGACVSGIGAACLIVGWGVAYAELPKGKEAAVTAFSFFVSFSIFALVSRFDYSLAGSIISTLPCLSGVGLVLFARAHAVRDGDGEKDASVTSLLRRVFSWRFVLGLILTMGSYGGLRALFADTFSSGHESWIVFFVSGIAAVIVLLAIDRLAGKGGISIAAGYKVALPLIALACSLVLAFDAYRAPLADAFATAASALIEMFTWIVLVNICRVSNSSSATVFASGRFFVHMGMILGESFGFICVLVEDEALFMVVSVVMVVVATSVLFADGDFHEIGQVHGSHQVEISSEDGDVFGGIAACVDVGGCSLNSFGESESVPFNPLEHIADTCGLTAREKEVLDLWGAGYGSKYIQDRLCISQATVKTHVRHIYEKIGVRNRPELMLRLEECSGARDEQAYDGARIRSLSAE